MNKRVKSFDDDFGKFIPLDNDAKVSICDSLQIECIQTDTVKHPAEALPLGTPCRRANVDNDRDSFFRAISKALSNSENNYVIIRNAFASHLTDKGLGSWPMSSVTTPVHDPELEAMADMLQLRIYTYSLGKWTCSHNAPVWDRSIYLLKTRECAYDLVRCVKSLGYDCSTCERGTTVALRRGPPKPVTWSHDGERVLGKGTVPDESQGFAPISDQEGEQGEWRVSGRGSVLNRPLRPWTFFVETWDCFIKQLGECWWGAISLSEIVEHMTFANVGEILVTGPITSDSGVVCAVSVLSAHAESGHMIITHDIILSDGEYKCSRTNRRFRFLTECVKHIVSTVQDAVILCPKHDSREHPFEVFGAPCRMLDRKRIHAVPLLFRDMAKDIEALPDSSDWFRRATCITDIHITFEDVGKFVWDTQHRYGVIACNPSRNMHGYLFDIITKDDTITVTFSQHLGYVTWIDGFKTCYSTLNELMSHCKCTDIISLLGVNVLCG